MSKSAKRHYNKSTEEQAADIISIIIILNYITAVNLDARSQYGWSTENIIINAVFSSTVSVFNVSRNPHAAVSFSNTKCAKNKKKRNRFSVAFVVTFVHITRSSIIRSLDMLLIL